MFMQVSASVEGQLADARAKVAAIESAQLLLLLFALACCA
jgi:hypothetical protein